jgi:hypothetical protein
VEEPVAEEKRPFLFGLFERVDLVVFTVLFLALGIGIGIFLGPDDWSLLWRVGAGFALGLTAVISLFAPRMIGGKDFD